MATRHVISPVEALRMLKLGNYRFANNMSVNQDLIKQVKNTQNKQEPFAAILGCMDSRTSSELIFDLGIGDVFSVRIAGNIISEGILGSLEYATAVAGANLIVVLGHTNCGAIKGACDDVKLGNLTYLMDKIRPAVEQESEVKENRSSSNPEFVDAVTHLNIQHSLEQIMEKSPVIAELVNKGDVGIITGLYDVATGKIKFYESEALIKHEDLIAAAKIVIPEVHI